MQSAPAPPKVHPASREILPDDPLEMTAFQIPGDPELMLRMLVEEYARAGWGTDMVMELSRDPNYRAFHGLWRLFGEEGLREKIRNIMSRCGVMRVTVREAETSVDQLVELELLQ